MITMTLEGIARAIGAKCMESPTRGKGVSTDSRAVEPGEVFFAIPGERFDGHDFVAVAQRRGAVACVVSRDVVDAGSAVLLRVEDTVRALGRQRLHPD